MKNQKKIAVFFALALVISVLSFVSVFATEGIQLKSESNLSITSQDGAKYIVGFSERKTVSDLLLHFDDSSEIKVYKNNESLGENEIVSTGTLISCGDDEAYVVIKGDTNGDGIVDSTDYLQIKSYFTSQLDEMGEIFFLAADTQDDGQINSTDYLQIKGYFVGIFNLYPDEICFHNFGEWVVSKSPDCTEKGIKTKTCKKCSAEETAEISPLGHTEVIDEAVAPTTTSTGLTEGKHCSVCKTVLVAQEIIPALSNGNVLWSETLLVEGKNISGVVSNSTDVFSFINDIHVENKLLWVLSADVYGMNNIATKTAPLGEGENIFYIHVTLADQSVSTYTVNIYRKHMYTVSFDTSGGTSVEKQYVEEGYFANEPTVMRDGYTFDGWSFDFSNPIIANTTIKALWIANTNTPYKVEYYLQNVDKTEYELLSSETENFEGTTDTTAIAEEKSFEHFTLNRNLSELSGKINGQGTLVLKVYYTRNTYSVSASDTASCSITNGGTYAYDTQITVTVNVTKLGYCFVGWYSGDELLSISEEYSLSIDKNVVAKVEVADEMKNFNFTSTAATCAITGLKDKSVTSIVIPDFVTSIGDVAFSGCENLAYNEYDNAYYLGNSKNPYVVLIKAKSTDIASCVIHNDTKLICYNAFYGCESITSITIPDSVTFIGDAAFYECAGLLNVTIPDSVTSIGDRAFYGCTNLESITIPDGVPSIGNYEFYGCTGLTSVTLPDSVTSIGESAFRSCTGLSSITIPDSVITIDDSAFSGCSNINNVYYEGEITEWLKIKFGSNTSNPMYSGANLYIKGELLTNLVIPESVTYIGVSAFFGCTRLTSITIPDSVTSIGVSAFYNCTSLTSITIPESVTYIGSSAFSGCEGLESITIPESVTYIGSSAFSGCEGLESITIPNSVTSIDEHTFSGCKSLTSVTIPNSVTSIGRYAFCYCTSLTSITIPDSVTSIGVSAFYDCTSLESITIPESVTSIGVSAFSGCEDLESITIPDSVTSIGNSAFYNCTSLTSVTIGNSVTSIGNYAFRGCEGITSITIPDSVTSIGNYAFENCTSLTIVTIGNSVTSVGEYAFRNCTTLTSITIPDGVTSIGDYAFYGCKSLTSVIIPNIVTSIGRYAFCYCTSLTSVTIWNSVTSIGEYAFRNCTTLTSITIPDSVTSIGRYAFYNCTSLTSITLPFVGATKDGTSNTHFGYIFGAASYSDNGKYVPASLKTVIITGGSAIGSSAFKNCTSLTSITIPESVTSIEICAFIGCSGLLSIEVEVGNTVYHSAGNCLIETQSKKLVAGCKNSVIPTDGSVTYIGAYAFSGCEGLKSITIPDGVTSIGSYAFEYCTSLTSITIPDSVTSIGSEVFSGCWGLTSVTIPDSVTSIGRYAFKGCEGLKSITLPFVGANKDGTSNTHFGYIFGASSYPYNITYVPTSLKTVIITGGSTIGDYAFSDCEWLTSITIPDSVTSIGDYAFSGCLGLTSVTIPDSVTTVGSGAFSGCSNINNVYYEGDITEWLKIKFGSYTSNPMYSGANLYIKGELLTNLVISVGITSIGDYVFDGCKSLTSVTIPKSVTYIGSYALSGCKNLVKINYTGKISQWNAIEKGMAWNYSTVNYKVYCSDGTI